MKIVAQRVNYALCTVDGKKTGEIQKGLLCFVGIGKNDTHDDVLRCVDKIGGLRVFEDEAGKMSRSCEDIGGSFLLISQFTLYGSVRHGKRPDFVAAASPDKGKLLFDDFVCQMSQKHRVQTGIFGADMQIEAHNDGPVTIIFDTENL